MMLEWTGNAETCNESGQRTQQNLTWPEQKQIKLYKWLPDSASKKGAKSFKAFFTFLQTTVVHINPITLGRGSDPTLITPTHALYKKNKILKSSLPPLHFTMLPSLFT